MAQNLGIFEDIFQSETPQAPEKIEETGIKSLLKNFSATPSKKTEKIHKRNYNASSKWSPEEERKYLKFIILQAIEKPHNSLSWKSWKPQGIFPRMASYIKTKTPRQCKSFDERKKQSYFNINQIDILEYAERQIRKYEKFDIQISDILHQLERKRLQTSDHMMFIARAKKQLEWLDKEYENYEICFGY